jgi:hypothetical protein
MARAKGMARWQLGLRHLIVFRRRLMKVLAPKLRRAIAENDGQWILPLDLGNCFDGRKVYGVVSIKAIQAIATVKFLCEAALGPALNADQLPGGQRRGGVLTPATD